MVASQPYRFGPVCFAGAFDLQEEATALGRETMYDAFKEVTNKERSDCPEWTQWMRGFSPKEHREMLLEEEAREFQSALVQRLEHMTTRQEEQRRWWWLVGIGISLILATLAAPTLANLAEKVLP